jgi:signal transduction histidine kinase/CheY-like chemotaxis protein
MAAEVDDLSRAPLACALRCLDKPGTASLSLNALLTELASAFAATAAGVAQLPGGEPIVSSASSEAPVAVGPWRENPELVRQVALSPSALAVDRDGVHWLLAAVDGSERAEWLLWLCAPATRPWSPSEAAALTLTGQSLARHLRRPKESPRWAQPLLLRRRRQRFEDAALVARRLAHDYGNVLTGIFGFSELALSQLPRGGSFASYMKEIHRSVQVGERLTNMLRLLAPRQWPNNAPSRIAAVVADEVRRLHNQFPGVCLDVTVPPDLPPVNIAAEPLHHVLSQLLDNAAEAIAFMGRIQLLARSVSLSAEECLDLFGTPEPGGHVEIAVQDNGCGLSAEVRKHLLVEPFFTTKTHHRGYGLGVVFGILAAHHGAVVVEPADGCGTRARVYLPIAPATAPVTIRSAASGGSAARVLVVDDDPMILELVQTTLRRAGYHVETVTSMADAVRCFTEASEPFGLVVSDVVMPQGNGFDLARQLRQHDAAVPVLFMSGQVASDPARPLSGSGSDLLAKPFGPEGLLRAVRSALERGRPRAPAVNGNRDEGVHSPSRVRRHKGEPRC